MTHQRFIKHDGSIIHTPWILKLVSMCLRITRRSRDKWKSSKTVSVEREDVINIKNHKIKAMIDEILKRTHYFSPDQYLEDRVKRDYEMVLKGKKIN